MKTYTPEELKEILDLHKLYLAGDVSGKKADLSYSDLRGSDLSGSNLSGSDLHGSNLSDSNLRHSDLSYSDLRDSDLRGSNLSYSDLRGSNLSYSDLRGSDLRGSDLRDSDLSDSNLRDSNLRGSNLRHSDLRGVIGFIYIGQRSDGYCFNAVYVDDHWRIEAGCRNKTVEEYRKHTLSYICSIKRQETFDLLDFAEKRIKLLGRTE